LCLIITFSGKGSLLYEIVTFTWQSILVTFIVVLL
jgi:hypothetical protein